ncbi:MAG: N-6 DNA methylase [Cyclobacteriaceae bacterium]|nr:N-6 DNA methylase [Cyclobacteriaceae bacterium]MCH8517244.1 N-6 DNA methylase [Cyclobacteriaceae bacterium]
MLEILHKLGFSLNSDKNLESDTEYKIIIEIDEDITKSKIDYGSLIIVHHKSTSNLRKPENLVVLECVIRLLKKGYQPKSIELEKTWASGHGTSGRLDVLLRDKAKQTFAMIECKTWGEEYLKEKANTLEDGGQIFSYCIQEKSTKLIFLYASKITSDNIDFIAEAIPVENLDGSNSEELHRSWDKSFINESIFNEEATLYFSSKRNLKKQELKELDSETGKGLFNEFAEILRRYAVSDKTNAFNKIFNLFVCKIYDEDTKNHIDELDFQWKVNDTYDTLVKRLSSLYTKGVKDFLGIEIQENYFSVFQEFAFIDIYNDDTFKKNFDIVKEVVEFLQNYQIKYTSKHQFLGDFFEDLLNSGVKQEAGQFFTPTPLSRFFIKSLPITQIIENKIDKKEQDILPFVIDYSCGAGHFLSESIDEIEEHINRIDVSKLVGRSQKHFLSIKDNFFWAKDFIYGIEKDYRLAKTTKVAMFLYGDGDAIIINGDGLDDFEKSLSYQGILKTTKRNKNLEKFDIVVSNPPFSISGFKQDLVNGKSNFDLYNYVSNKSSEIECFFIERTFQVLKPNGYTGLILPLSILYTESRIYIESRKLILLNFDIVGIVELRDKTFKPTNTTTAGLFLRKRENAEIINVVQNVQKLLQSEELEFIEELEFQFPDYSISKESIKKQLNEIDLDKPIIGIGLSLEIIIVLNHFLNKNKKTVVAYSGEKKEQELFLGYRYSTGRRREGLEILERKHLFNENDINDNSKINAHILSNFNGKTIEIPNVLKKHINYIDTCKLIEKGNLIINNPSKYFESDNYVIETNSPLGDFIDEFEQTTINLSELIDKKEIEHFGGIVYSKQAEVPYKTNKKVITASNMDLRTGKLIFGDKIIYLQDDYELPEHIKPITNDIIISNSSGSLKHLGKVVYVDKNYGDSVIGGFLSILRCKDEKLSKAIFYRMLSLPFRKYVSSLRGQNINNMDLEKLKSFKFEIPNDLDKFTELAITKEKDYFEIIEKMNNLRNNT